MRSGLIVSIDISHNGIAISPMSCTFAWVSATLYIVSHLDPLTSKPSHMFRKSIYQTHLRTHEEWAHLFH